MIFGKPTGHQPGLSRGVFPRATCKEKRSGNSGFPSADEYEEHEYENMEDMNVR